MTTSDFIERLHRLPFVRLVVPFVAGILCEEKLFCHKFSPFLPLAFVAIAFFALFFVNFAMHRNRRWINGCVIYAVMFLLGVGITYGKYYETKIDSKNSAIYKIVVEEEPQIGDKYTKLISNVCACRDTLGAWLPVGEKTIVYAENDSAQTYKIGDVAVVYAKMQIVAPPQNPDEFDYAEYLARRGIYSQTFVKLSDIKVVGFQKMWFKQSVSKLQKFIFGRFEKLGISGREAAVLRALTIGDKQLLDDDLRNAYASAGAMHVLAVSGLHVGLVFIVLSFILGLIFDENKLYGRIIKSSVCIAVIWLYAAIAGFSPSVSRACVMFSFVLIGNILGKKVDIYNSLAASALFLCAINPYNIFEVGFQLSYSALLAIVYFQPIFEKMIFVRNKIMAKIWSLVTVAVAAQIGTAVISLFYFHRFPNYFIITNIIIIPIVTIIMYLIVGVLLLSWIPFVGQILGKVLDGCLWLANRATTSIEAFPYSVTENIYVSGFQVFVIIVAAVLLALYIETRYRRLLIGILTCVAAFFAFALIRQINSSGNREMIIYSVKNSSYLSFINGRQALNLRDSVNILNNFDFNTQNYRLHIGLKNEKSADISKNDYINSDIICAYKGFVWFGGKSIKIAQDNENAVYRQPINVDFLVVSNNLKQNPKIFLSNYKPQKIIIDSSIPAWTAQRWIDEAANQNILCHYVKRDGAFICKFL